MVIALARLKQSLSVLIQSDAAMNFANGQPVPITTIVKYLGSVVTWDHPTETAIAARFSIARTALQSIRLVWNSRLPQTTKLCIFHSVVVSSLTYGLNCLTLAHKHFKLIDGYYFRLLRRVLGIPASYTSRVSNLRFGRGQVNQPQRLK